MVKITLLSGGAVGALALLLAAHEVELSSGQEAPGSVEVVEVPTQAIAGSEAIPVAIFAPEGLPEEEPGVLIFLHGLGGNEMAWSELGGPEALAVLVAGLKLPPYVVVAPRGHEAGWSERADGSVSWERFLIGDLLAYLDEELGLAPSRNQLGITGVSAGGVKALTVAFRHPELFGSVTAHSPAMHPADPAEMPDWARDWEGWKPSYGDPIDIVLWQAQNPVHLAEATPTETLSGLAIYFDVGADDHLGFQRTSGMLSAALAANRVPHEFAVRAGGHGSAYYRSALPYSLDFHGRAFARAPVTKDD